LKTLLFLLLSVSVWAAPEDVFSAIRSNDLGALKKADVNVRDRRGNTPLQYAAGFGTAEAIRLLLDGGADVNSRNGFEATPLIWAAGNLAKTRLLIERGADVNARTRQGRTALMVAAACNGCSESVRLLLAKGADAKALDTGRATALTLAAENGDAESIRLLLEAGADPKQANGGGMTPLHLAIYNCDLASAKLLLAKGADVNVKNTFSGNVKFGAIMLVGLTPLHIAAPYCGVEVVDTLLAAGAAIDPRDVRDMTPLMLAVASETQNAAVVRRLLRGGADVNAKSAAGESSLDWARKFNHKPVLSLLTAAGAKETAKFETPHRPAAQARTIKAAVETATTLLQRATTEFQRQSGCVGCHHQPIAVMATSAAKLPGSDEFVKQISTQFASSQDSLMQRFDPGGGADAEGYFILALHSTGYAPDSITDTIAVHTAAMQHAAGNWHVGDASRSPVQESEIARTVRAMRTLQLYGPTALRPEFDRRIAKARAWTLEAKPKTNDDAAMQLLAAHWTGGPRAKVQSLGRALATAQRPDGGWAQNPNLESDAYATGESLWALHEAGLLKPADPAYQRGVKFLLTSQWPDGSWYVRSRAPKFQPYFESGFPFAHDQWVSSAATSYAVMALAPAIEKETKR
jgi:ankyrin repeat protein